MNPTRYLKQIASITLLLPLGCMGEAADSFDPIFQGLKAGTITQDGCVSINGKSARLEFNDIEQTLTAYNKTGCSHGHEALSRAVPMESQLAGILNNYVVLDEGTGSESREIHLLPLADDEPAHSLSYTLSPTFTSNTIEFHEPLDEPAEKADCPRQADELAEWSNMGFDIRRAAGRVFDLGTGETHSTGEVACYPLN